MVTPGGLVWRTQWGSLRHAGIVIPSLHVNSGNQPFITGSIWVILERTICLKIAYPIIPNNARVEFGSFPVGENIKPGVFILYYL